MWFKLQLETRRYLLGVFSLLENCFYWRASNVHRNLIGNHRPRKKIVKSCSLRHVQPEDLHVNPKIQLYSTEEMLRVVYDSGGPELAQYVSDVLNYGRVRNYFEFAFSVIYNEGPEFVSGLGGDFERRPLLKHILDAFGTYITKAYWSSKNLQRRGIRRAKFFRRGNRVVRGRGAFTPPRFCNRRAGSGPEHMSYPDLNHHPPEDTGRPSYPRSFSQPPTTKTGTWNSGETRQRLGWEESDNGVLRSSSTTSSEASVYVVVEKNDAEIPSPPHQREENSTRLCSVERVEENPVHRPSKYRFVPDEERPRGIVSPNRNHAESDHSRDSAIHPLQGSRRHYVLIPSPTNKLKATIVRVEGNSNSRLIRTVNQPTQNRSDGFEDEERSIRPNSNYRESDSPRDFPSHSHQQKRSSERFHSKERSIRPNSNYRESDSPRDFSSRHQWKRSSDGFQGEERSIRPNSNYRESHTPRDLTDGPHQFPNRERPTHLTWESNPSGEFNGHPHQQNHYYR